MTFRTGGHYISVKGGSVELWLGTRAQAGISIQSWLHTYWLCDLESCLASLCLSFLIYKQRSARAVTEWIKLTNVCQGPSTGSGRVGTPQHHYRSGAPPRVRPDQSLNVCSAPTKLLSNTQWLPLLTQPRARRQPGAPGPKLCLSPAV